MPSMPAKVARWSAYRTGIETRHLPGALVPVGLALIAGVAATHPGSTAFAGGAVLACALVLLTLPVTLLVAVWAALLPIWSIGSLPPVAFDAMRLLGALAIAVRSGASPQLLDRRAAARWLLPLGAVGLLVAARAQLTHDELGAQLGRTMLISIPLIWLAMRRLPSLEAFKTGYLLGAAASALLVVLSATGFDVAALVPQTDGGYSRLTGLAPSATLIGYELAAATVIAWTLAPRSRLAAGAGLLCAAGLLLCGGRGGLLGLALAGLVLLRWGSARPATLARVAVVVVGGLWLARRAGVGVYTLDRLSLTDPAAGGVVAGGGLSTGRGELAREAWARILADPWGSGLTSFVEQVGYTPHVAPLTMAVAGGLVAGLVVCVIAVRLGWLTLAVRPAADLSPHLLAAVMLAWIALEPDGPFVGAEGNALLMVSLAMLHADRLCAAGDPDRRRDPRSGSPVPARPWPGSRPARP